MKQESDLQIVILENYVYDEFFGYHASLALGVLDEGQSKSFLCSKQGVSLNG